MYTCALLCYGLNDYSVLTKCTGPSLNTQDPSCVFTCQPKSNQGLDQCQRLTQSPTK